MQPRECSTPSRAWPRLRSWRDIAGIDRASRVAWDAARSAARAARPGMRTDEIADVVRRIIEAGGARPAFSGYQADHVTPFSGVACVCVGEEALHAPPGARVLVAGDLLTVDVGVELDGWFGDVAESVIVPGGSGACEAVLRASRDAAAAAIGACRPGAMWSAAARAARAAAARRDMMILRGYGGHGIGARLHEVPAVSFDARPGGASDFVLLPGMVMTIEPVLLAPPGAVETAPDGWTVRTADGSAACHMERTVCITRRGVAVLGRRRGGRRYRDGL